MIVMLYPGASDTLTLRGITLRKTLSPKNRRTSAGDLVGEFSTSVVHGQDHGADTSSPGLRCALTIAMFLISWETPSSA